MIVSLKSDKIQGVDLYIKRFQDHLEENFSTYTHYPRLYKINDGYGYYKGDKDYETVIFSDKENTTGFYVENVQYLGNISQCDLFFLVAIEQTQDDTRDDSYYIQAFRDVIENTTQAKSFDITEIARSDEFNQAEDLQPKVNLKMKIEITYVDTTTLKT